MTGDLVAELTEASYSFDSHNYVTSFDCELLDRTIAELKRLQAVEHVLDGMNSTELELGDLNVVLAKLERLQAMERRAIEVRDSDIWMGEPAGAAAYILGEAS